MHGKREVSWPLLARPTHHQNHADPDEVQALRDQVKLKCDELITHIVDHSVKPNFGQAKANRADANPSTHD